MVRLTAFAALALAGAAVADPPFWVTANAQAETRARLETLAPVTVLRNAKVVTLDPAIPEADAIVIQHGLITAVVVAGKTDWRPDATIIDLNGATVLPGFVDAHMHVAGLGGALDSLDLSTATSEDDAAKQVAERVKTLDAGAWITGGGWNQNDWPSKDFPTHAPLDAVSGDHPASIDRIDGHAVWVNAKALSLAGIDAKTPDPVGGKILRDAKGEPTGVLLDKAISLVAKKMPASTPAEIEAQFLRASRWCFEHGITEVHDAGIEDDELAAYQRLDASGALKLRVQAMLWGGDAELIDGWIGPKAPKEKRSGFSGKKLRVHAIKLAADGALGSRGARLLADYSDDPGNRGLETTKPETIEAVAEKAMRAGWQIAVHAIGDGANRSVLDALEKALKNSHAKAAVVRPRIEHAQIVSLDDLPRFAKLGITASMQPWHVVGDKPWAEARVGAQRIKGGYAWNTLARSGAHLCFGSDAPAGGISSPLQGIHAAVTRQDDAGKPEAGWYPAERLTRDQAIRGFTEWPAWVAHEELEGGTITPGKRADLVVLSADPRSVPDDAILKIRILRTIVGGETVYTAE